MKPNFTQKTKDILAKRAAQLCSNPDCRKVTSIPHSNENKAMNLGEAAHIKAARKGQARFEEAMTDDERSDISNGIWLCRECARKIDLDPLKYTVGLLHEWKQKHDYFVAFKDRGLPTASIGILNRGTNNTIRQNYIYGFDVGVQDEGSDNVIDENVIV